MIEKEHILSEIRRLAEENGGKPLGRGQFFTETGIREGDWIGRYWARWSEAVEEAGFQPNKLQGRHDDDEAIRQVVVETQRLGHFPTVAELRLRRRGDKDFPGTGILKRLGPKQVLAGRVAEYCEGHPEYADVLEIVAPLLKAEESSSREKETGRQPEHGFVYLLKSGRYYKLGRTNSVGRREYELAIQLPERAVKVHVLTTDDPAGIEAYWHKRFADRRKNGEWFELTQADVSAFKRRKFM